MTYKKILAGILIFTLCVGCSVKQGNYDDMITEENQTEEIQTPEEITSEQEDVSKAEVTLYEIINGERRVWIDLYRGDEIAYNSNIANIIVTNRGEIEFKTERRITSYSSQITLEDINDLSVDEIVDLICNEKLGNGDTAFIKTEINEPLTFRLQRDDSGNNTKEEQLFYSEGLIHKFEGTTITEQVLDKEYIGFKSLHGEYLITVNDLELERILLDSLNMIEKDPKHFEIGQIYII